jgi:hypothetical protein
MWVIKVIGVGRKYHNGNPGYSSSAVEKNPHPRNRRNKGGAWKEVSGFGIGQYRG